MPDALDSLTREFLTWVARRQRTYADAMEAWRSSCPRHTVWEDAIADGLIAVESRGTRNQSVVSLTQRGEAVLDEIAPSARRMEVVILPASVADAAEILDLQKLAYESEARLYDDWSIPPLTQTLEEIQAEFGSKTFLQARLTEVLVGSVRASLDGATCAIGRLVVHPQHQRQGIGSRLMKSVELMFPAAERYELFTGDRSEGNLKLYARLGYRRFRNERVSPQLSLVIMEKRRSA